MRRLIGVFPSAELERRARLFAALEEALPVRFQGRGPDEREGGLDALIAFGELENGRLPDVRSIVFPDTSRTNGGAERVDFGTSQLLDPRLRARALVDGRTGDPEGLPAGRGAVLASSGRTALWTRTGAVEHVALAPEELGPEEALRDLLAPGRWLSLLPLVHFLRQVAGDLAWRCPPTRASFIVDDPNLHWPSYGHLRFRQLAEAATEHAYHVAFGTIPLDAWLVHPGVARLFRENTGVLSLLVHGNNHTREELNRDRPDAEALSLLAQALRRVSALERRTGLDVSRIMVAPHGLCAEPMLGAMLRAGFEGLCYSWPAPRSAGHPLADWWPADIRAGGLPVFPRLPVTSPRDDLVLRSFLGQPLILYAHHTDLASGLDVLDEAAAFVNREERVRWGHLAGIARSSYLTRHEGTTLRVRIYARRIELDIPEGVEELVVELPPTHEDPDTESVTLVSQGMPGSPLPTGQLGSPTAVEAPGRIEIVLSRSDAVDVSRVPSPPRRLQPVLRRAATETRDRMAGLRRPGRALRAGRSQAAPEPPDR